MPQTKRHWLDRATDPSTPATEDNETVRTETYEVEGKYYLVPTIRLDENDKLYKPKDPLREAMDNQDALIFSSQEEADSTSKEISELIGRKRQKQYAKGGITMDRQMSLFAEGGMMDNSGEVVNGVEVPPGSLREEVADDVPAKLSEGEFVIPADVVRYIGLEKLMAMRDKAKMGLERMQEMGQMGNAQEVENPDQTFTGGEVEEDDSEFESEIDSILNETNQEPAFASGGAVTVPKDIGAVYTRKPISGYSMTKYANSDGEIRFIPTVNGVPLLPIPEGYSTDKVKDAEEKAGITKPAIEDDTGAVVERKVVSNDSGGGGDMPTSSPLTGIAAEQAAAKVGVDRGIVIDPVTGKATVAPLTDDQRTILGLPLGTVIVGAQKLNSWVNKNDWNDKVKSGDVIKSDSGGWIDISNANVSGMGVTEKGQTISNEATIARQDKEFEVDNSKEAREAQRAEAEAARMDSSSWSTTPGYDIETPDDSWDVTPTFDYSPSGGGSSGDSNGGYSSGDGTQGSASVSDYGGETDLAKGGLVKRKYPAKKKSKKGLASRN